MDGKKLAVALGIVAVVVLVLLGVALFPSTPVGPPPPQPLPQSVLAHAAPAKAKIESKALEPELPADLKARREALTVASAKPTPQGPVLRQTPGIAPWKIVQHSRP